MCLRGYDFIHDVILFDVQKYFRFTFLHGVTATLLVHLNEQSKLASIDERRAM